MAWHGYWALEDLNLSGPQRGTLRDAIVDFFQGNQEATNQPAQILHYRLSLDGRKAIFEAKFNEDYLTVDRFKAFLANTFGVAAGQIGNANSSVTLAGRSTPLITFSRSGTNYIRVALFGGVGATWEQSRNAVLAYLDSARAEWDAVVEAR